MELRCNIFLYVIYASMASSVYTSNLVFNPPLLISESLIRDSIRYYSCFQSAKIRAIPCIFPNFVVIPQRNISGSRLQRGSSLHSLRTVGLPTLLYAQAVAWDSYTLLFSFGLFALSPALCCSYRAHPWRLGHWWLVGFLEASISLLTTVGCVTYIVLFLLLAPVQCDTVVNRLLFHVCDRTMSCC